MNRLQICTLTICNNQCAKGKEQDLGTAKREIQAVPLPFCGQVRLENRRIRTNHVN